MPGPDYPKSNEGLGRLADLIRCTTSSDCTAKAEQGRLVSMEGCCAR